MLGSCCTIKIIDLYVALDLSKPLLLLVLLAAIISMAQVWGKGLFMEQDLDMNGSWHYYDDDDHYYSKINFLAQSPKNKKNFKNELLRVWSDCSMVSETLRVQSFQIVWNKHNGTVLAFLWFFLTTVPCQLWSVSYQKGRHPPRCKRKKISNATISEEEHWFFTALGNVTFIHPRSILSFLTEPKLNSPWDRLGENTLTRIFSILVIPSKTISLPHFTDFSCSLKRNAITLSSSHSWNCLKKQDLQCPFLPYLSTHLQPKHPLK